MLGVSLYDTLNLRADAFFERFCLVQFATGLYKFGKDLSTESGELWFVVYCVPHRLQDIEHFAKSTLVAQGLPEGGIDTSGDYLLEHRSSN